WQRSTHAITAPANKRQAPQNSATSAGGGGGGAFTGIVRSAAETGAGTLEKLSRHDKPIAKMLPRIIDPLFCSIARYPAPTATRKSAQAGFPCKNLNFDESGISATG